MKLVYKQMHETFVRERNFKLECLDLEIALAVTKLVAIQSTKAIYTEKQDDKEIHLESEKQELELAWAELELGHWSQDRWNLTQPPGEQQAQNLTL